jgi:predicted kinase
MITDTNLSEVTPSTERANGLEFIVLGGGSSVGKTTLTYVLKATEMIDPDAVVIKPELIREMYPELVFGKFSRHPEKDPDNIQRYYAVRDELVTYYLSRGVSVVLDEHCDDHDSLKALVEKVEVYKPETALIGVFMDPVNYLESLRSVGITDSASKDFKFAISTASEFAKLFPIHTRLFDTTLLLENDFNGVWNTAKYTKDNNGQLTEVFLDEDRFNRFYDQRASKELEERAFAEASNQCANSENDMAEGISQGVTSKTRVPLTERLEFKSPKIDWRTLINVLKERDRANKHVR